MAASYPLSVNGTSIPTSEALFQVCKFPHSPDIQALIIAQTSPMAAKMKARPHRQSVRPDWQAINGQVMRWCLHVKLAQNWRRFGDLLLRTGDRPIVEESHRDTFWGARSVDADTLAGFNLLGRLLMELRAELLGPKRAALRSVPPPDLTDFLLVGQPIAMIEALQDD